MLRLAPCEFFEQKLGRTSCEGETPKTKATVFMPFALHMWHFDEKEKKIMVKWQSWEMRSREE
jgi:hypothetical protein